MVNLLMPQESLLQVAKTAKCRHFSEQSGHNLLIKMLANSLVLCSLTLGKEGKDKVEQINGRDKFKHFNN